MSGAIAGEWWLLVGVAVAALVVGVVVSRRRRRQFLLPADTSVQERSRLADELDRFSRA